jgi:hypothetical protein
MVDLMYQLPEEPGDVKYVITRDIVEGKAELFSAKQNTKKESAERMRHAFLQPESRPQS